MNYTLNQLQIFLKVAENQSITKAAEELFLTQPAVSVQLKNFQAQFDIPLTEVVGRQLYITDFGREIAQAAEAVLHQVTEINRRTLDFKGQLSGKLKISVVSTGKYVMPYFLSTFLKAHPGAELLMDVTNKTRVIESLEQNQVDFSLVSVLPDQLRIEQSVLLQNILYLIGNPDYPLKKKKYNLSFFEKEPLIYREKGSATRQTMEQFIEQNNFSVSHKIELTSNEAVKQAVIAGLGYSIMPLIGIKNELMNGDLKIIPVNGLPIRTEWRLIWMKGKKHSPLAAAFLQHLEQEKENIVKEKFSWFEQYQG